jgi:hypothetical protein
MPTATQRAASRANSQKSTGPRTTAGKAVSRFNALKHGIYAVHQIMFDEKPEDLAELSAEYYEHHSPANPHESLLVDTLVLNEWRLRRMRRVEAGLWQSAHDLFIVKNIDTTSTCTSGDAFATGSSTFERLQRVVNTCERVYHRALKQLQLIVARGHALRTSQPQQSKPAPASPASFRYFSQTSASAAPNPAPAPPFTASDPTPTPPPTT